MFYMTAALTTYFDRVNEGDATVPSEQALLPLSRALDSTVKSVVQGLMNGLYCCPEHDARVTLLRGRKRLSGKYSKREIIFEGISPFEQMSSIAGWLSSTHTRKLHTLFLESRCIGSDDHDYIPTRIMPAKRDESADATTMQVFLGSTTGARKAPRYVDLAELDPNPREHDIYKFFIDSLTSLEIVRQPQYSAATVLKGNAYGLAHIDADWRYGETYACVEDKGQSKPASMKKERSAGLNACALLDKLSDSSDPIAEEKNLCLEAHYEDYAAEGYADDLDISVSAGAIIKAAKTAIVDQNDEGLARQMQNLTISILGKQSTPALREQMANILLTNSKKET